MKKQYLIAIFLLFLFISCNDNEEENADPVCSITSPLQGEQIYTGSDLPVSVSAEDPDGSITTVHLYMDLVKIGETSDPPYNFVIPSQKLTVGGHAIKAIVYDNSNNVAQSNISIYVRNPVTPAIRYSIGDYYLSNNIEGIVYKISSDSLHGMLLALDEAMLSWARDSSMLINTYATHTNNGLSNLNTISLEGNLTAYPALFWASEESSWYLPAKNELSEIQEVMSTIQGSLYSHSGTTLTNGLYWSSTEIDAENAWSINIEDGEFETIFKLDTLRVRRVHSF